MKEEKVAVVFCTLHLASECQNSADSHTFVQKTTLSFQLGHAFVNSTHRDRVS